MNSHIYSSVYCICFLKLFVPLSVVTQISWKCYTIQLTRTKERISFFSTQGNWTFYLKNFLFMVNKIDWVVSYVSMCWSSTTEVNFGTQYFAITNFYASNLCLLFSAFVLFFLLSLSYSFFFGVEAGSETHTFVYKPQPQHQFFSVLVHKHISFYL